METPMARAILQLFGNLAESLAVRNVPAGAVDAYLFGGCAVHLHTQSRASSDVDVEFMYRAVHKEDLVLVLNDLPPVDYDDPLEGPSQLSYDPTFNTTLGPLHDGYQHRAICLERGGSSPVTVWLPSAEDIAISKLGRLGEVDVQDIVELLSLPTASWASFELLAREAGSYYVGPDLTGALAYVRKKFDERRPL